MRNSCFLVILLCLMQCRNKEIKPAELPSITGIPVSIQNQHDSLIKKISGFVLLGDSTALAAEKLLELMQHHFNEEEDYVLPALNLLPALARNEMPVAARHYLTLVEQYRKNTAHITAEHQFIKVYLQELQAISVKEGHGELSDFAAALHAHAKEEEEIYFPLVIVLGNYLHDKIGKNQD